MLMLKCNSLATIRSKVLKEILVLTLVACIAGIAGVNMAGATGIDAPVLTTLILSGGQIMQYNGSSFTLDLNALTLVGKDQNGNACSLSGRTVAWAAVSGPAALSSDGHTLTITGSTDGTSSPQKNINPITITATVNSVTSNALKLEVRLVDYIDKNNPSEPTNAMVIRVYCNSNLIESKLVTTDMINALNPGNIIYQYSCIDIANRHKYYSGLGAPLSDIISHYTSVTDMNTITKITVTGVDNYQAWWPCPSSLTSTSIDLDHLLDRYPGDELYYYPDGTGTNSMNNGYLSFEDDANTQVAPTTIATLAMGDPLKRYYNTGDLDTQRSLRIYTGMLNTTDKEDNNSVKWVDEIDVAVSTPQAGSSLKTGTTEGAVPPTLLRSAAQKSSAVPAQTFTDVSASYWAIAEINGLSGLSYISGYPDGTFKPDSTITRAEFVSIIAKALKLPPINAAAPCFDDVASGDWFCGSVESAVYVGIIKGYGQSFNPNQAITREELAAILVNAMGEQDGAKAAMSVQTGFTDDASISGWARGFIAVAVKNGLIRGYPDDNSFRPRNGATRAEACAMIDNFLKAVT